jgi:hypothetical protein
MKIKIINETTGNPFEYFSDDTDKYIDPILYYPRGYNKQENVQRVMSGLLKKIGLDTNIDCLEIGSGHNLKPSQSLSNLGARVVTLDADWNPERHTEFPELKDYDKLRKKFGKEIMIPRIAGQNGNVVCYLGDVAFLKDEKSELKDYQFDLAYFFGSLNYDGCCSCVEDAQTSKEFGINISFPKRLLPIISAIKDNGRILATSSHFSGYMPESEKYVGTHNLDLVEIALYYALGTKRKAKSIGIFVQTPESVMKTLGLTNLSQEQKERLLENPFEQAIKNGLKSLFGKDNNYENLRKALDTLNQDDRIKLTNLGLVDAVYVEY